MVVRFVCIIIVRFQILYKVSLCSSPIVCAGCLPCPLYQCLYQDLYKRPVQPKFRLGARTEDGCYNGVRVREAKTESFVVKDHRGELYKKHHPPVLEDEVWRLEKIGKEGAFHKRLNKEKIVTVKDFLTLLHLDAPRLRKMIVVAQKICRYWALVRESWTRGCPDSRTIIIGRTPRL